MPRLAAWLAIAVVVTWPLAADPFGRLIGHPDIDVWNHAWGYWFVADAIRAGHLPFHTTWAGAPEGGTLWFIDALGAFGALPVTLLLGAGPAYNLVMFLRVALAGLGAQLLTEEISGRGPHTWLGGVAYATTPFLLAELGNGISEVCAVSGVPFGLWALHRALRRHASPPGPTEGSKPSKITANRAFLTDFALVGLTAGLCAAATPYYGVVAGSLGLVLLLRRPRLLSPATPSGRRLLAGLALAGAIAAALALPPMLAFRASIHSKDALIERSGAPSLTLLAHNAVDPREFLNPGAVRSVDLKASYQESFVHTGYLRWSVFLLAVAALIRHRDLRFWAAPALVAAIMGLGAFLWWGKDWVRVGGNLVSLPFWWLTKAFPAISITHPLRLSLGLQAVAAALAGAALAPRWAVAASERGPHRAVLAAALALVVAAEGAHFGGATWPIPTSEARIPDAYEGIADGTILELPVLVGETMAMQRYFWYQTRHRHPLPFPPDIRVNRPRDVAMMWYFGNLTRLVAQGVGAREQPLPRGLADELRKRYVALLVHLDLEQQAGMAGLHRAILEPVFGEPEERDGVLVWTW